MFLYGYGTFEYSWVKATTISVRLQILFVTLWNVNSEAIARLHSTSSWASGASEDPFTYLPVRGSKDPFIPWAIYRIWEYGSHPLSQVLRGGCSAFGLYGCFGSRVSVRVLRRALCVMCWTWWMQVVLLVWLSCYPFFCLMSLDVV